MEEKTISEQAGEQVEGEKRAYYLKLARGILKARFHHEKQIAKLNGYLSELDAGKLPEYKPNEIIFSEDTAY